MGEARAIWREPYFTDGEAARAARARCRGHGPRTHATARTRVGVVDAPRIPPEGQPQRWYAFVRRPAAFGAAACCALLVVAASCGDSVGPERELVGVYDLVSIDGRQLPTTLDGTNCGPRYAEASLLFAGDNDGRVTFRRRWTSDGCGGNLVTEAIPGRYDLTPNHVGAFSFTVRFGPPYGGLSAGAGEGWTDLGRARIAVPLRDASVATPPPAALFNFQLR
jgi:hypothetical protein